MNLGEYIQYLFYQAYLSNWLFEVGLYITTFIGLVLLFLIVTTIIGDIIDG